MQIGTVLEVANADGGAHAVVREALQMVDQILARVEGLGHRPFRHVLKSEMAVEIDQRRHDRFAGEVNVCSSGRDSQSASAAHLRELVAADDEGGVLDWRAAVSRDQARTFKDGRSWLCGLAVQLPEPSRTQR